MNFASLKSNHKGLAFTAQEWLRLLQSLCIVAVGASRTVDLGHKTNIFLWDKSHSLCLPTSVFDTIIVYLYSVQYLHILQDSKCYLTNVTAQEQPNLSSD